MVFFVPPHTLIFSRPLRLPRLSRVVPRLRSVSCNANNQGHIPYPLFTELRRAQQLRKAGDWNAAKDVLSYLAPQLQHDTSFLNETILITAAELQQRNVTPHQLVHQLYGIYPDNIAMNTFSYNAILSALRQNAGTDAADVAEKLIKDMLDSNINPDHFTLSIIFQICAGQPNLDQTIRLHEKLSFVGLNAISGSSLVVAFVKCNDLQRAEQLLQQLMVARGLRLNGRPFSTIMSAFARKKNHGKVLEYYFQARDHPYVQLDTYIITAVLKSCISAHDSSNAVLVFKKMEKDGINPTAGILEAMLKIGFNTNDTHIGERLLFEYFPRYRTFKMTSGQVGRLISCYKADPKLNNAERAAGAARVFRKILSDDIIPLDIVICNCFVSTLCGVGRVSEALKFVVYEFPKLKLDPDVYTYNSLIHGYKITNNPTDALSILQIMQRQRIAPNQVTYNSLLDTLPGSGFKDARQKILREIEDNPRLEMDDVTFTTQLKRYREQQNTQAVVGVHQKAVASGTMLDAKTYGLLLSILLENGLAPTAISIFAWLFYQRRASVETLNTMLEYACRVQISEALTMFKAMKIKAIVPNAITYTIMIRGAVQSGMVNLAFRLLAEMQDVGCGLQDPFAWTALIDGCGKAGQWERGVELFDSMSTQQPSHLVPAPTTATYNAALYAAGVQGENLKTALRIFDELKKNPQQKPDSVSFSAMASTVLRNQEDADIRLVEEIICNLQQTVEQMDTKAPTAQGHVDTKKLKKKITRLSRVLSVRMNQNREND